MPLTIGQVADTRAVPAEKRPATAVETKPVATREGSLEATDTLRGATPLARRAALERDVDLSTVIGSGPGGRVVEEDVLRSFDSDLADARRGEADSRDPSAPLLDVPGSFEAVRLSAMRKTIARRMTESKQQVPHFYLRVRCSMDTVIELRTQLQGLCYVGRR